MSKTTVLDTRRHGYIMLFRDAVKATDRAIRKRWGRKAEIPLLSHALSDIDEHNRWHVRDISGNDVSIVIGNKAYLVEDGDGANECNTPQT